jgi:hypothetical protein
MPTLPYEILTQIFPMLEKRPSNSVNLRVNLRVNMARAFSEILYNSFEFTTEARTFIHAYYSTKPSFRKLAKRVDVEYLCEDPEELTHEYLTLLKLVCTLRLKEVTHTLLLLSQFGLRYWRLKKGHLGCLKLIPFVSDNEEIKS